MIKKKAGVEDIVNQIIEYVPLMSDYYKVQMSLADYSKQIRISHVDNVHAKRLRKSAQIIQKIYERIFGLEARYKIDIEDVRSLNVVDHHQLLNHPLLLSTNIIPNASRLLSGDNSRPIITMSCANVPTNNDYMRGGIIFSEKPVKYFSQSEKHDCIYYLPFRMFDFVERLKKKQSFNGFNSCEQSFLIEFENMLNSLGVDKSGFHRDQIALAIHKTWPLIYDEKIRNGIPDLVYINLEEFTSCYLKELLTEDNFIVDFLFSKQLNQKLLAKFRGTFIAWDEASSKGTHFFWLKHPAEPRLLRMYIQGDWLVPEDERYSHLKVEYSKQGILDSLSKDEIIPSVAMIMTVLLYTGTQLLIGPGSLVYTSRFKKGWTELLSDNGYIEESALMSQVDNSGLIAGAPLFFKREGGCLKTLYACDIMYSGGVSKEYLEKVLQTPFREILAVGATGVYDLFSGSHIPDDKVLKNRVSFNEAAQEIHRWI